MSCTRLGITFLIAAWMASPAVLAQYHDPLASADPRPLAGPHPVACSNVAQDFSRVGGGESAADYWEGVPRSDGSKRYASDLLSDAANTLLVRFTPPDDRDLFGEWRQQPVTDVLIVCYPTSAANDRPDYALPNGKRVPRMQRGAEAPILAEGAERWPLLLFSHGYGGSPLSNDYIEALAVFASNGYIVAAPFHGDPRYADLDLGDVGDFLASLSRFERFTAMQALRPLSISATIDLLLAHPHWSGRIDATRIGGFGASLGGETMMLLGGAELTKSISMSTRPVIREGRIKAAVGYVPYFGALIFPAFGPDNRRVEGVTLPFLAIGGTADLVAPLHPMRQAMRRLAGSRALVTLAGVEHGFDPDAAGDIFTWSLDWLDALVNGDPLARVRIQRVKEVSGGAADVLELDYVAPAAAVGDERTVIEYYNASLDHYFITAEADEVEMLDQGVIVPGWSRTGRAFKSWVRDSATGVPACRYVGTPNLGQSTHFYSTYPGECAFLSGNPLWTAEGTAFRAQDFIPELLCAADRTLVWRLYNNGKDGMANHRYVTGRSDIDTMLDQGWMVEGPAFCMPP